jgi:hypothetical protein
VEPRLRYKYITKDVRGFSWKIEGTTIKKIGKRKYKNIYISKHNVT